MKSFRLTNYFDSLNTIIEKNNFSEMRREKEIISLLLLFLINLVRSDMFCSLVNREDPCINLCEKTPLSFTNVCVILACF